MTNPLERLAVFVGEDEALDAVHRRWLGVHNYIVVNNYGDSIHPRHLAEQVECLGRALAERPHKNYVALTHSPYLLDQLPPDCVWVAVIRDGNLVMGQLVAHPKWSQLKYAMRIGEFWAMVGEDWLP